MSSYLSLADGVEEPAAGSINLEVLVEAKRAAPEALLAHVFCHHGLLHLGRHAEPAEGNVNWHVVAHSGVGLARLVIDGQT